MVFSYSKYIREQEQEAAAKKMAEKDRAIKEKDRELRAYEEFLLTQGFSAEQIAAVKKMQPRAEMR